MTNAAKYVLGGLLFQGCFWKPRCDGHLGLFCSWLCPVALERSKGIEIVPTAGEVVPHGKWKYHPCGRISSSGAGNSWLCFREHGKNCLQIAGLVLGGCKDIGGS